MTYTLEPRATGEPQNAITRISFKSELEINGEPAGPVQITIDNSRDTKLPTWVTYSEAQRVAANCGLVLEEA